MSPFEIIEDTEYFKIGMCGRA